MVATAAVVVLVAVAFEELVESVVPTRRKVLPVLEVPVPVTVPLLEAVAVVLVADVRVIWFE